MGKYWFATIYGVKDSRFTVAETVINYFNELGTKLIAARDSGVKIHQSDVSPLYAYDMRQVGCSLGLLNAAFTGGTEHRICEDLFGVAEEERVNYHQYFDNVYKLLCAEVEGGYHYVGYEKSIILQSMGIRKKRKLTNEGRTFQDLYDFIQTAKRDDFGYHVVYEDAALHIYDGLNQVNVCAKDEHGLWLSICNFVFHVDEGFVSIYTVTDGNCDYGEDNRFNVMLNTRISQLRKAPDMPEGSKIRKIILAAF